MTFKHRRHGAMPLRGLVAALFLLVGTPSTAQVILEDDRVESATIVIGSDSSSSPPEVEWTDGVCYTPVQGDGTSGVLPGDRLEFRFAAHNVYQMASLEDFLDCDFTNATLLAQVGESPFTYAVPEDATNQVLYFACQVGDHCASGTQKVQVAVNSDFWINQGGERLPPVSGFVMGTSAQDCNDLQAGVADESIQQMEANQLLAECSEPEPVEGEPHTFFRSCLSGPATLTPGGVINRLFLMYYPFPTDHRVALGQRNFEFVTGSFEEGIVPVPVNQMYVHHLSGNIVFGQGAEGLRQDAPDAPFAEPYALMSGDEGDFTIFHLIDLREVDDWLSCIECRCPASSEGTYLDELTNTGNITGGVNCCTNCTDQEGPTVDYRMRYNVTYRELQSEDEPITHVEWATADISPAIGMFLEYDVPSYQYLPEDQQSPDNEHIQRLERVEPFNVMFKDDFFNGNYSGPAEVPLLRCVSHLHVAAIGQWLEDAETGEVLCSGETVYGTNPETDEGFLTAVSVDNHDPAISFPADRLVRLVTDYNATHVHTGVMGYMFVFFATPAQVRSKDTNLTVDLCIQSTCDASLLPTIDLEAFQPSSPAAPVERQADPECLDTIEASPSCTFGGLCDCESFVNAPESSGCNGFYSSAFGDIEVRSVCANYCGCEETTVVDNAIENTPSSAVEIFSLCKDTLIDNPACQFGGLCDCEEFTNLPESGGCGGTYTTEMGSIVVNDVCAAYCGNCEDDVSSEELFEAAYMEVVTTSLHDQCQFSTEECQTALSNMYSCAEEQPGIETVDPLIRNFVVKHGHSAALENAKLGHPSLHADQEDQVVGMCAGVAEVAEETVEAEEEEPLTPAATETVPETTTAPAPAPAPASGDCEDTLSSHPACRFGGLCDCKAMVNSNEVEGYGCNGVYKNSMGDVPVLAVCQKYCGCPGGEIPEASSGGGLGSLCFSEDSTVEVYGKGTTAMKHLSVGDRVLTFGGGDHTTTYEPVYGFAHLERTRTAEFLKIQTKHSSLEVTADHLVYGNGNFKPAKSIRVGDVLQTAEGQNVDVTKITSAWKMGLYAPLTPSGSLLVDGVRVSSYVTILKQENGDSKKNYGESMLSLQHGFIHMVLSPLRMACLGISPDLCSNDHINEESGYPPYVGLGLYLADFMDQRLPLILQLAVLFLAVCVFGPLYLIESSFGAALVPGLIVGLAAIIAGFKCTRSNPNAILKIRAVWKQLKLKME